MSPLTNGVFHFNHAAILGTGNDKQQQTPPYSFVVGVQKTNIGLTYRYSDGNNSNVQGRYILFDRFTVKAECTLGKDISSSGINGELEYKADSCTLSLKGGMDPSGVGLLVGMSILQAITKRVRMGYDMMVSEQQAGAMSSFLLRYKSKSKNLYQASINPTNAEGLLVLSIVKKITSGFSLYSEFRVKGRERGIETESTLGYAYDVHIKHPQGSVPATSLKACITSNGLFNISWEGRFAEQFWVSIFGVLDYQKSTFKPGFGISYGR